MKIQNLNGIIEFEKSTRNTLTKHKFGELREFKNIKYNLSTKPVLNFANIEIGRQPKKKKKLTKANGLSNEHSYHHLHKL